MLLYLCTISSYAQFVSVSSLLLCRRSNTRRWPNAGLLLAHRLRSWPSIKQALVQRFVFAVSLCCGESVSNSFLSSAFYGTGGQTRRWPNAELMLAHHLRRCANISPVLCYRVVFGATLNVGQRHRWRANINPALVQSIVTVLYRQRAGTAEWSTD